MNTQGIQALEEGGRILYTSTPIQRVLVLRKGKTDWEQDYQISLEHFYLLKNQGKLREIDTTDESQLLSGHVTIYILE